MASKTQPQGSMKPTMDFPTGFPRVSRFMDSDDAFMVYRRFGTLFSRVLLRKQDELSRMEAALLGMDKTDEADGNEQYLMSYELDEEREEIPNAWGGSRSQLMEKIEKKALEYGELLLKAQQLKALDRPSSRDYRSVLHFLENDGGPLFERQTDFIYEKEDLVTLRPARDHAWLDDGVAGVLTACRCSLLTSLFSSKVSHKCFKTASLHELHVSDSTKQETREKTDDADIHYYDRDRIRTCSTMIIALLQLTFIAFPVWLIYRNSSAGVTPLSPDTMCPLLILTGVIAVVLPALTRVTRD